MALDSKLTLRVKSGPGFLIGVTELQSVNGRVDFNGIQLTDEGEYILEVVSSNPDIEPVEFNVNVLPEEEFIPQEEVVEEEEKREPLEGTRPIVSQIQEPSINLPPMSFDKSANDKDNSEIANSLGYIPFLWYNGIEIRGSDIVSLKLFYKDGIPNCKVTFVDTFGVISNDDTMPLNDTNFEVFINSGSEILKSIHLKFKMQFNQESKSKKTQTITGVIDIDDFYKTSYKSYVGTSFEVLKRISSENGLGFNSNISNTVDSMTWRKNGLSVKNFMNDITKHSYISDNSFVVGYVDFYWCFNYIDVEKEWKRNIKNDLALNTHGLSSILDKTELVNLTLTNDPSQDSSAFYFQRYKFRNNSTYQSTNKGVYTISRTYDRDKKQFLKFDIDSLSSDQSENVILKSKPSETNEIENNYNTNYGGKIDSDNMHQNYHYAVSQNIRNKENLYNITIDLELPHPNFNLYRYQKIRVNFINLKQTPINENIVNQRLTGEWVIADLMFYYSKGRLKQKLTIVRKELSKTLKEKNNQEIEDTSENNSEINENPTDGIIIDGEQESVENQEFVFSGGEFTEGAEFTEREFRGEEESEQTIPPEDQELYNRESEQINNTSTPPTEGNYDIDLIPGLYVDNSGNKIELCQVEGNALNTKIVGKYLDMKQAASNDGVILRINSGFRSPYDNINTQSNDGVRVRATSQDELYKKWKAGVPGYNLAAPPGKSKHGNGISLDLNTGSRRKGTLNENVYSWLVKNSWNYGFVRSVRSEEWHFDYLPNLIKTRQKGPYTRLAGNESNLFFSDLGLDRLT